MFFCGCFCACRPRLDVEIVMSTAWETSLYSRFTYCPPVLGGRATELRRGYIVCLRFWADTSVAPLRRVLSFRVVVGADRCVCPSLFASFERVFAVVCSNSLRNIVARPSLRKRDSFFIACGGLALPFYIANCHVDSMGDISVHSFP